MSFPQKVKSTLWAIVDSMACNLAPFVKNPEKDFSRNRKHFYFLPDDVPTASAFIQQRAKLLPETFRHILKQLNLLFPPKRFMGRSKKGFNSLHTISLCDLLSKRYLDVVVQPGRLKNEFSALCQLIDRYLYGGCPIFVADRGFASYIYTAMYAKQSPLILLRTARRNIR